MVRCVAPLHAGLDGFLGTFCGLLHGFGGEVDIG